MTTVIEEFVAKLGWDVDSSGLIKASRGLHYIGDKTSRMSASLTRGLKTTFWTGAAGAGILGGALGWVAKQFSKIEDAEAQFTPLLGSVSKAKDLVQRLNDTAASTPFRFENISDVASQLLPIMNGDLDKTIETFRMLGDTAGGNVERLKGITLGYTKAMLKGKVDMESLNIIGEKQVPIIAELGKMYGKSTGEVLEMSRRGQISLEDLTAVFKQMTSEGGLYYGGMDLASRTLTGRLSTLLDNVGQLGGEIGSVLVPYLKEMAVQLNDIALNAKKWVIKNKEIIKSKVVEYIKKIPGIIADIVYWAPKIAKLVVAFYATAAAIKVATVALDLFTAAKAIALALKGNMILKFFAGELPQAITIASVKAQGLQVLLGKIGLVGGAAVAGWMIGTAIHNNIIEPLMKARAEAKRLKQEFEDAKKKENDPSRKAIGVLEHDIKGAKRELAATDRAGERLKGLAPSDYRVKAWTAKRDELKAYLSRLESKWVTQNLEKNRRLMGGVEAEGVSDYLTPELAFETPNVPSGGVTVGTVQSTINVSNPKATPAEIEAASMRGVEKALKKAERNYGRD